MFNQKKKHFQEMLKGAEKVIWEIEFKKYTAILERETVRKQYDQLVDALNRINAQLENDKTNESLLTQKAEVEKNITDTKAYMDSIDGTISGSGPTAQLPNGAEGLDNQLRSWVTKRDYIKSFMQYNT